MGYTRMQYVGKENSMINEKLEGEKD